MLEIGEEQRVDMALLMTAKTWLSFLVLLLTGPVSMSKLLQSAEAVLWLLKIVWVFFLNYFEVDG